MSRPDVPAPIVPPYKVRREVRTYLHGQGFHGLCRIRFEPVITGYDNRRHWLAGSADALDVSVFGGEPIYSARVREIHE